MSKTARIEGFQIRMDFVHQIFVVRPVFIQPENRRCARYPCAIDREFDPIAYRQILCLTRAPDIPFLNLVREQDLTACIDNANQSLIAISNVLSCDPYSSAFCAINPTLDTLPIVVTSNAPCSL